MPVEPKRTIYRSILRELSRSSPVRKGTSFRAPATQLRKLFEESRQVKDLATFRRTMDNALTFLVNQREYKELLARYNPTHNLTSEEHLNATLRRVGLQLPAEPSKSNGGE